MDEKRGNAMLNELQQQVIILSTRCTTLAADVAFQTDRAEQAENQIAKLTPKPKK